MWDFLMLCLVILDFEGLISSQVRTAHSIYYTIPRLFFEVGVWGVYIYVHAQTAFNLRSTAYSSNCVIGI